LRNSAVDGKRHKRGGNSSAQRVEKLKAQARRTGGKLKDEGCEQRRQLAWHGLTPPESKGV
jgi:hypothetical protein